MINWLKLQKETLLDSLKEQAFELESMKINYEKYDI